MQVEVTQEDLQAASYYVSVNFGPRYAQSVMDGKAWTGLAQTLASHRQAAERRALERAAERIENGDSDRWGEYYASVIRALIQS